MLFKYNFLLILLYIIGVTSEKCLNESDTVKVDISGKSYNVCLCKPGFTGWDCSIPVDYCNKHCKPLRKGISCQQTLCNQGRCVNKDSEPFYSCDCGPFFKGENCEIEDNPCTSTLSNPCGNGLCEFILGTSQVNCHCYPGWTISSKGITKFTWNGVDIFTTGPCIDEIKRGITGTAPHLGPNAKAIWSLILFISTILFVWILSSTCYSCFNKRK